MGRYDYGYSGFPRYVSVAEKRERNQKAIEKLRKKKKDISPVVVEGQAIAKSWWGKSWNKNLERYADFANRIGRGRNYVRHGAVLDLRVEKGIVRALVKGSRGAPYKVVVRVNKLSPKIWEDMRDVSRVKLDSLSDLLAGRFPEDLKADFFQKGTGLFPSAKEISFECSCPDWASMCKHVASVLYGIGNRLDDAPELFFELRQVSIDDLISETVKTTSRNLIDKAEQAVGDDVIADADLADVFGIEMDDTASAVPTAKAKPTKKRGKKNVRQAKTEQALSGRTKKPKTKKPKKKRAAPVGMIDTLMRALGRSKKAFQTADLIDRLPEWTKTQVTATLQRAISEGRVERVSRGVYKRR